MFTRFVQMERSGKNPVENSLGDAHGDALRIGENYYRVLLFDPFWPICR
jgi:hypothetical protein